MLYGPFITSNKPHTTTLETFHNILLNQYLTDPLQEHNTGDYKNRERGNEEDK
jgi:hypothetical protein